MSQPIEPPLTEQPTRVRYGVLTFLCVLAFIMYVDRICLSQAMTSIEEDLGISHANMGWVSAAFTLAYMLFEVPTGWWGDKYGSRGVVTRIAIWWSLFTAMTGEALGLYSLLAIRFLFGAGEAGGFPNTASILSKWFPAERRGVAQGCFNASAQIGGAVAPLLTAYLIQWVGWRVSFALLSLPGIAWAIAFWCWYRDDPHTHPNVNTAERQLIAAGTTRVSGEHPPIPWRAVGRCPAIWLLGAVLACGAFNTYLYFSWYPTYLKQGRGLNELEAGKLASLVLTGGAIGCLTGGWIIDWLIRRTTDRQRTRRRYSSSMFVLAAICLLIGKYCDSPTIAATWTSASVMCAVSTLSAWWGVVSDVSGRHLGALFGLMNSLGGVGAIASQIFVGRFADWMKSRGHAGRAQWDPMFFVYAGVLILGAIIWLFIDTKQSVDADAESEHSPGEPALHDE